MTTLNTNVPNSPSQDWIAAHSRAANSPSGYQTISPPHTHRENRPHNTAGARHDKSDLRHTELRSLFCETSFEQHFEPNSTILLHGDPADAIYYVVSGTVRCCTIESDGSRQIFNFAKKGEFIGISDIVTWHFTAEAVDHVILGTVARATVERHLNVNMALRQELRSQVSRMLEQREKQLLSLVSKKAPERLFHFLCEFASSRPRAGSGTVALPMCRRDIADHLGLSVETVSRAFTILKLKGRIELVTSEKYRIED